MLGLAIRQLAEFVGEPEGVFDLRQRGPGGVKETTELPLPGSGAPLDDVHRHRECCSPDLGAQAKALVEGPLAGGPVHLEGQGVRRPPSIKAFVGLGPHTPQNNDEAFGR